MPDASRLRISTPIIFLRGMAKLYQWTRETNDEALRYSTERSNWTLILLLPMARQLGATLGVKRMAVSSI